MLIREFTCQTITPMFLAGADTLNCEFRSASFKGAMRFWWRLVNYSKDEGIAALKEREGEIFGDQTRRSSFDLIVEGRIKKTYPAVDIKKEDSIVKYFNYSLFLGDNINRNGIDSDTEFTVKFQFYNTDYEQDILKSFRVLSWLGGIGTRSRRGSGAFFITNDHKDKKDLDLLRSYLQGNKNLTVWYKKIDIDEAEDYYSELYKNFKFYKEFRETPRWLCGKAPLGLPLKNIKFKIKNNVIDRYASPYIFSFARMDGNLYAIITKINVWLPNNALIGKKYWDKKEKKEKFDCGKDEETKFSTEFSKIEKSLDYEIIKNGFSLIKNINQNVRKQ